MELFTNILDSVGKNVVIILESIVSWILTFFGCMLMSSYSPASSPTPILVDITMLLQIIALTLASVASTATVYKIWHDIKRKKK